MSNFFKENKLKQNENTKMIRNRRSKDIGDFILQDKIGSLPYGKRYKVKEKKTGEIYTASIFDNNIYESIDEQTNLSYMIEEMSELKHPTLQQFFGICPISVKNEPKTAVITERATDMTLHNLIRSDNKSNSNKLNETRKLIIIYGIALGMSYLHSHDVIHGDLNSGNILIDDFFFSKINGFGLSKISNIQKVDNLTIRSIIGSKESSPIYKSPEVLKGEKITKSSDVYSFGVVVYEIMTNLNPQENFNILDNLTKMRRGSYLKHEFNIPLSYHELIEKCLLKEPTKRPTFEEIINELTEEERFITSKVNQDDYLNYIKYIESYEFTKNVPPNKFLHSYTKTKIEESNNKNIIAIENFNNNLYPSRYFIQLKEECKTLVKESEQDFEKQFLVGQYLIEGSYHFPQNTQLGLKYLKNSFKNGYLKSLIYYCKMLIKGDIIPKNHAKVKKILENNLKDQETIYNLIYGLMLKNENKFIEALSYFEKSKNEEDGEIIYEYAKILHKICESKEDKDKCIEYFQKSIDKQYLRAMYKYGLMLIKGTIASNKKEDGIKLIKAAAEKGDLKSLYYYSSILEETGENKEEYMKFLKQAALKSHIESMYKYGIELSKENIKYDEYLILLKKASNKGHMKSIYQYGMSCQTEEESSLYLKIASDHGNSEAMYLYGYNLETGKGVPIDKEESLKYIKMSMEQGNTNAIVLYALRLYLFGKENDKLESIKFLKNAIDKGNSYAMAFYASILLYENSIQESMKYYKMGIDKDNIIAMNKYSINNEEESTDLIKHCHAKIRIEDIMNYYSFLLDYTNDSISYSNDSNISPNEEHSKSNSDEKKRKIIESFINNLNLKSNDSESDLIYDESYLPSSDLYSTENIFDSYPLLNLADFDILEKIETNKLSNVFKIQSKTTCELFLAQSFLYNQYHLLFQICIKHIIEKLAKFKHPSIVNFVGYSPFDFDDQPKPVIIKEFPSNGSLRSIFENKGKINNSNSWDSTTKLITIYGIAMGMKHLHSHYIDQYELIPENILFDHHFYPKINFEFTTKNQSTEKILNIPKIYRAPETYEKEEYTESSKVYTFSMIIYEIITNKRPFKNIEENEIKEEIAINNYRPPIPKSIPKCYKELIESCWSQDPRQRPTFETIANILESDQNFIKDGIDKDRYLQYIKYISRFNTPTNLENVKYPILELNLGAFANIHDYKIVNIIGDTNHTDIFKVEEIKTKNYFGGIYLHETNVNNARFYYKLNTIYEINHPAIIKFIGYSPFDFDNQQKPVILTEFPTNESLKYIFENQELINSNSDNWDSTTKLTTIYGIASGMKYLYLHNINHYELIPENILFDHHFYPKIKLEFTKDKTVKDLPNIYRAPETYEKEEYTESSEVYTFSMIIYEIITNKRPFKSIEENEIKEEITINNYRPPIPKSIPKCYKELIESCWSQDPRQRPTFETIVNILELNSDFITNDINRQTYKDYIEYLNINFNESKTKSSSNIILDIKKYTKLKKIGAGYSSKVYKIKNNYTNEFYAAKILKIKKDKDYHINLQREMKISLKLNHPSILKFYGISPIDFQNEPKIVIISELAQSSTLNDILDNERKSFAPIEWNSTKKLINIYGIASGMKYLHSLDIIHRDLKPANILLDQYLFPKISDFGLSKELKNNKNQTISNSNNIKGTMIYIAPEIFDNYIYSKAGDVYAFGLIVYELIVGEKPFKNLNSITMISQITKGYRPEFTFQIPDCYRKLIEACWSHDMYKRPTFSEIVDYLEKNESIRKDIDNDEFDNYIVYVEGHLPFDDDSTKSFMKIDADYIKFKKPNYLELSQNVEIIDIQKFDKVSKLGYGGYGKVYKVTDKETKRVFAAKILKNEITFLEEIEQIYFSREVNIISQLKHESIIKFYGYSQYNFKGKLKPSYIMELAYNQSLRKVLSSERQQHSNKFNNTKKFINIYGIVSVIKYLHSLDILHRDLKTDNIMLDEYLYPKLIDFGFSKELSEKLINVKSNALGTPAYVAPETWINGEHSKASDVYSFSMILYEILTNEIPFSKFIDKYQIYIQVTMNHYRPFINKNVPNCYRKLIESCWSENPGDRPTFEEILYKIKSDHNFILDDVDFNEFLLYTKKIGDDYITFNKLNEPQEKYEQSIEKVNLQLGEEKVNENTINVFNTVIKDEKQDKNYYIDINDYERQELIQEGDINKIHEVKDKKSGKIYEARISNIDMNQFSIEEIQQICIEMNKLSHLKHQSILRINGFSPKNFKNESKPVFITEITSKTTLSNVLELDRSNIQNSILDSTKKLINIYGIASGMKYLHSHDILHRNLKPSNILLDKSNYPKLSDFGMCNHLLIMNSVTFQSITKMQTNSYYQAPEILNSESHTKESDVYSFAMIVYEILTLEKPMNRCKDFSSLYKEIYMKGNRPKLLKSIPKCFRELIENCWCQTPRERITFDEIVSILRNDPSFITSDINQKEYYEYIENDDKFTE